jgi:hypothetical protein
MSHFVLTPLTELEAVNELLRAISESPVSSLSTTTTTEVTIAKAIMSAKNRDVQLEDWYFNTDYNVSLSRDSNNEILLPSNVVSFVSPTEDFTDRGGKVYDRVNRTTVLTQNITNATIKSILDFEDLPQAARAYITILAARQIQQDVIGQVSADRENLEEVARSRAALLNEDSAQASMNVGNATPAMFNAVRRNRLLP